MKKAVKEQLKELNADAQAALKQAQMAAAKHAKLAAKQAEAEKKAADKLKGKAAKKVAAKKAAAAVADTRAWAGVSEEDRVSDLLNAGLMRAEDVGFSIGEKGTRGALKFLDSREFARRR